MARSAVSFNVSSVSLSSGCVLIGKRSVSHNTLFEYDRQNIASRSQKTAATEIQD
jgi:hypothetical protein